jgi:vacuolar-type H+-ATPase subunit H
MAQPELWESELYNLMERLDAIVAEARRVPLTGHVLVEAEPVLALLDHMRRVLPEDLRRARWVIEEQERILGDARQHADETLAGVHDRVRELAGESAVTREAELRAEEIVARAEERAREMREAAHGYVDTLLARLEEQTLQLTERVRANRRELNG